MDMERELDILIPSADEFSKEKRAWKPPFVVKLSPNEEKVNQNFGGGGDGGGGGGGSAS